MSEMIERVTKAIFDEMDLTDGLDVPSAERYAIAAIKAMREPTQEMLERGCMDGTNLTPSGPSERLGRRTAGERMADQWRGMIDQALSHSP